MGYSGDIYVGSNKQKMTVFYETASNVIYQCYHFYDIVINGCKYSLFIMHR